MRLTGKSKPLLILVQPGSVMWTGHPSLGTDLKVARSASPLPQTTPSSPGSWAFCSCCYGYIIPTSPQVKVHVPVCIPAMEYLCLERASPTWKSPKMVPGPVLICCSALSRCFKIVGGWKAGYFRHEFPGSCRRSPLGEAQFSVPHGELPILWTAAIRIS